MNFLWGLMCKTLISTPPYLTLMSQQPVSLPEIIILISQIVMATHPYSSPKWTRNIIFIGTAMSNTCLTDIHGNSRKPTNQNSWKLDFEVIQMNRKIEVLEAVVKSDKNCLSFRNCLCWYCGVAGISKQTFKTPPLPFRTDNTFQL